MSTAATEAVLRADLMPLEGVESLLVRHMARAHAFAEACFDRAEVAEAPAQRDADLRLATRLLTHFDRALAALGRHRARLREDLKAFAKESERAQFDQALHLAALADSAVAAKAKGAAAPAGAPERPTATPDEGRRLSRQQRRAAARRLRKAGGVAQGP